MLQGFSDWLTNTSLNAFLSDTTNMWTWLIVPMSQTIHIVGVAIVMLCVGVLNLKLLGISTSRQSFAQLAAALLPWLWGAMIALFLTGFIQTLAEPGREILNVAFQIKVVLLIAVVWITKSYQKAMKNDPNYWENSPEHQRLGRFLALTSLALWFGIAAAGRLIAYLDMRLES